MARDRADALQRWTDDATAAYKKENELFAGILDVDTGTNGKRSVHLMRDIQELSYDGDFPVMRMTFASKKRTAEKEDGIEYTVEFLSDSERETWRARFKPYMVSMQKTS